MLLKESWWTMADLTELNFCSRQDLYVQLAQKTFQIKKILPGKIRPQWGGSRLCSSVLLSPDPGRALVMGEMIVMHEHVAHHAPQPQTMIYNVFLAPPCPSEG